MKQSLYVVWTRHGIDRSLKTAPIKSSAGEYTVRLDLEIPDEVFAKQPVPVIEVKLDKRQIDGWPIRVDLFDPSVGIDAVTQQQLVVHRQLAALYRAACESEDPNMVKEARVTLDILLDAGVDVRIVSEDAGHVDDKEASN